ncbi:hypothetical protein [Ochrobactrum sp. EDr1-4]|uniref:hypothetical protein n=1 Tax=Ochrobactrum sp. EDr1-4 TaxID=3368622 RepID=UPI003BA0F04E
MIQRIDFKRGGYTFAEHRQRFAGWAAATAARSSTKCRFTREEGLQLIQQVGLLDYSEWKDLPSPQDFDTMHLALRNKLCTAASDVLRVGPQRFTHGVAAKLLNCYFKALYLSGPCLEIINSENRNKANSLHPPIDRLLLTELARRDIGGAADFWRTRYMIGWSNFSSDEYQKTIDEIRRVTDGELWRIEQYWLEPSCLERGA